LKFSPNQVQIVPKGEQFSALYQKDGVSLVIELCFSKQGRARITVKNKNEVVEEVEIRLPTTNFLPRQIQVKALIYSTLERHIEKLAANNI
jgi:hypothetical protein